MLKCLTCAALLALGGCASAPTWKRYDLVPTERMVERPTHRMSR